MLRFRKFVSRGRALGRELVRGGSLGVHLGGDLVVDVAPRSSPARPPLPSPSRRRELSFSVFR